MAGRKYRVIQWATGVVGQAALKHFIENPEIELVGVCVTNPAKVGQDAGALVGGREVGARLRPCRCGLGGGLGGLGVAAFRSGIGRASGEREREGEEGGGEHAEEAHRRDASRTLGEWGRGN